MRVFARKRCRDDSVQFGRRAASLDCARHSEFAQRLERLHRPRLALYHVIGYFFSSLHTHLLFTASLLFKFAFTSPVFFRGKTTPPHGSFLPFPCRKVIHHGIIRLLVASGESKMSFFYLITTYSRFQSHRCEFLCNKQIFSNFFRA